MFEDYYSAAAYQAGIKTILATAAETMRGSFNSSYDWRDIVGSAWQEADACQECIIQPWKWDNPMRDHYDPYACREGCTLLSDIEDYMRDVEFDGLPEYQGPDFYELPGFAESDWRYALWISQGTRASLHRDIARHNRERTAQWLQRGADRYRR